MTAVERRGHMAPDAPEREGPRTPFAAFLQQQRKGSLHGELTDAVADLVQDVVSRGKKGTLALTFTIAPNNDGLTVTITDKVVVKTPEADRGASMFFVDEHGNLTRNNPAQPELPLRDAASRTA